jgi:hypothetical protein
MSCSQLDYINLSQSCVVLPKTRNMVPVPFTGNTPFVKSACPLLFIVLALSEPVGAQSISTQNLPGAHLTKVSITVTSAPTGLSLLVGQTACISPCSFSWQSGSTHTISASTQSGGSGVQYAFQNWSDGGAPSHTIKVSSTTATYVANFSKQYYLITSTSPSTGGSISPGSGWFTSGAVVSVSARANTGYLFSGFSGALMSATAPVSLTVTGPAGVTANFSAAVVAVSLTPAAATLRDSQGQQFSVAVTGWSNTGVTWSLSPAVGTISSAGLYTAPSSIPSAQSVSIIATSMADPTKSATSVITLMPVVALQWTASISADISGYNVYRSGVSGGPYSKINPSLIAETSFIDSSVQSNTDYYYVATAVDTAGVESDYSTEAQILAQ